MQEPQIKLQEVIWEITTACKNGCLYCGSKNILNTVKPSVGDIMKIGKELFKYGVGEVNFAGGDPLLIDRTIYEALSDLRPEGTMFKMIVNPKTSRHMDLDRIFPTLDLMDVVGISVNTAEELELAKTWVERWDWRRDNGKPKFELTIITNFSLENIYEFEDIEALVLKYKLGWQIQYTIDKNLGLYHNPKAAESLFNKIRDHYNHHSRRGQTFVADNMNDGKCGAGMHGCGILANGDVVPCLSMRSYLDILPIVGNLLEESMRVIWEQKFSEFRCKSFYCCKDVCQNLAYYEFDANTAPTAPLIDFPGVGTIPDPAWTLPPTVKKWPDHFPKVIVYGVQPNIVQMYAVQSIPRFDQTFVYGVQFDQGAFTSSKTTDTIWIQGQDFIKPEDNEE